MVQIKIHKIKYIIKLKKNTTMQYFPLLFHHPSLISMINNPENIILFPPVNNFTVPTFYQQEEQPEKVGDNRPNIPQNSNINDPHPRTRRIPKRQPKTKARIQKNSQQGEAFKSRIQKSNRNIRSNTLKIYLRQVRDLKSQTYKSLQIIISHYSLEYTPDLFIKDLNRHFPRGSNYIVGEKFKFLCKSSSQALNFQTVLRVSIIRFFRYEIFCVPLKSVKTTRQIRNHQIRQGKGLIDHFKS